MRAASSNISSATNSSRGAYLRCIAAPGGRPATRRGVLERRPRPGAQLPPSSVAKTVAWRRSRLTRAMSLKYAPRLEFVADELFDEAARFERLLSDERARSPVEGDDDAGASAARACPSTAGW